MKQLDLLVSVAKKDNNVVAAILFGSYARGERHKDIDVCLVLSRMGKLATSRKKLSYAIRFPKLDVQVFQQLPLYVRARVLKEGKILFCKDEDMLFDLAYESIQQYEDFKPRYEMILGVTDG